MSMLGQNSRLLEMSLSCGDIKLCLAFLGDNAKVETTCPLHGLYQCCRSTFNSLTPRIPCLVLLSFIFGDDLHSDS